MQLDIKLAVTVLTIAATLGGFYYTTQMRLDNLEASVEKVEKQIKQVKKQKRKINR